MAVDVVVAFLKPALCYAQELRENPASQHIGRASQSSHLLHSVSVSLVYSSGIRHERLHKCADHSEKKQDPVSVHFHFKLRCHSKPRSSHCFTIVPKIYSELNVEINISNKKD